ncbi:MAG TPA: DMT family transporter [Myxococcales bacterium]|jgi:drug/metabolite transporter (DMT)-like permease|nr:DMT family transporter [Myxococcales bacterium]
MATPPRRALLYGGLLLHTALSAGSYLCGKTALREIPPLPLGLLRFLGASVLLSLLLLRVRPPGQRMPPKSAWPQLLVLSFVVVPVSQGFFQTGLALSTAAHAALLYSLTPLFVLLLAQALRRELPGLRTALGTLIALAGTLYVLAWRGLDLSRGPLVGDLLLLVAVIAWALFTAEGRPLVTAHGPLPVIAWTLIAGTAMYLPLGVASLAAPGTVQRIVHASRAAWLGVGYLILVTSVIAYLLWYWALAHLPAARVAVFTNLQPLATAVLAHLFLGEHVTPQFIGGALVVISGVVLAQLRAPRTAAEVPPEPA